MDENGVLQQETLELWTRDPVECIRDLVGNPAFKNSRTYSPVRVYRGDGKENREYSEMNTGDWWWETQVSVVVKDKSLYSRTDY